MKLIIYYDYRDLVGGLTSLYITLFEQFVKEGRKFLFFNYTDGIVVKELRKKGIEIPLVDLDTFNWDTLAQVVQPDDVILLTAFEEWGNRFMSVNPRVMYYVVHEFIGKISQYKWGLNFRRLGHKLVKQLDEAHSLLVVDDTPARNSWHKLRYAPKNALFLPVPIKVPAEVLYQHGNKSPLRLTYIGRSAVWKMMPLKKMLADIKAWVEKTTWPVHLSIVVDDLSAMYQLFKPAHYTTPHFTVEEYQKIAPTDLNNFLLRHTDIGFAMGTAALDFAKLGIPVILTDFSYAEMPADYRYNWLYNTLEFNLGHNMEEHLQSPEEGFSMESLLNEAIRHPDTLEVHARRSYHYAKASHDVASVTKSLFLYATTTQFRIAQAKPYNAYYWPVHRLLKALTRS